MKIGIDTCGCDHARSGVGSYLLSFISNLPKSDEFTFELFGLEEDRFTYSSGKEIVFSAIPSVKKTAKAVIKNHYDAVIFPAADKYKIKTGKVKSIIVINTLYSSINNSRQKKILKNNIKNADFVIAGSNAIMNDLEKNGIHDKKIQVIYNGIDHKLFYPVLDLDSDILDIKPFAIKRPYFIYCSSITGPDKNHLELIKAFELFKKNTGFPQRLVIAGNDGEYSEILHKIAFESSCAEDIFITGFFPFESLARLYAGSDACIFPAQNEGVGLPVLEAMACGVPVLCSNSAALPEMGGDVPLYFEAKNIEKMAALMEKTVRDSEIRKKMIENGIKRASEFNWETTVAETLNVLK